VAGNVGTPLTWIRPAPGAWLVVELSSFQLEDVHELRPRSACCSTSSRTTSTGTARSRPTATRSCGSSRSRAGTTAVVPRGFGPVPGARARRVLGRRPAAGRAADPRPHNRENAARAVAAARAAGSTTRDRAGAARVPGVPHRLEPSASAAAFVRQRLEGDEHGSGAARSRRIASRCT
jgi:hypothetical protein